MIYFNEDFPSVLWDIENKVEHVPGLFYALNSAAKSEFYFSCEEHEVEHRSVVIDGRVQVGELWLTAPSGTCVYMTIDHPYYGLVQKQFKIY